MSKIKKKYAGGKIAVVTGGARSGKSDFALSLAKNAKRPFYVATGWAGDEEMTERIRKHREQRSRKWTTIEERFSLSKAITMAIEEKADFIVVDCLTLWTSNMVLEKMAVDIELEKLANCLVLTKNLPRKVFVTNEVWCGIVPENRLAREFRDAAGIVNKKIAKIANEVYLLVCGIETRLKP
jgi:adenosylcobinamide kinase/adenosylcobinamide-phosphate guanylyltransferase